MGGVGVEGVGGLRGDADFIFAAVSETGGFVGDFGEEVEAFFFGACWWVWVVWGLGCVAVNSCCAVGHVGMGRG